jgi:hypothetical protein
MEVVARGVRGWLRQETPLGSAVGTALVTPIAHFANTSWDFQAYLYGVFHRSTMAKVGHAVCMPALVAALIGTAFTVGPVVGAVTTTMLCTWYVAVASFHGMPLLGAVSAAATLCLAWVGATWAEAVPSGFLGPIFSILWLGFAQTMSHIGEPDVPPRVSGTDRWVPLGEFIRQRPIVHSLKAILMVPAGMVNEIWGSWRLLPIVFLQMLTAIGYRRDIAEKHARWQKEALAEGNPAIDFIGTGGAAAGPWR